MAGRDESQPGAIEPVQNAEPVSVTARFEPGAVDSAVGGAVELQVVVDVDPAFYTYAGDSPAGLPTRVSFDEWPDEIVPHGEVTFPEPTREYDATFEETVHKLTGEVVLRRRCEVEPGAEGELRVSGRVTLQACDATSCVLLEPAFTATLTARDEVSTPWTWLVGGAALIAAAALLLRRRRRRRRRA